MFRSLIKLISLLLIIFFLGCENSGNKLYDEFPNSIKLSASNKTNLERKDEIIEIDIASVKRNYNDFNLKSFIVTEGENELPSQLGDSDHDGKPDKILFLINFNPNESKNITIRYSSSGENQRNYKKRTQAYLGEKKNYKFENGYYTEGNFESVDSAVVPKDHFAHDALYQFEGPGWESELAAYRFYLDSRNRTDIFGKKVNDLVLQKIGAEDLVSNSKETYTKMLDWGMDIFKVGESLGIGSIGVWENNKVYTVSDVDSIVTYISSKPIRSNVYTKYFNWKIKSKEYNLFSDLSISAGSRLTKVSLKIEGDEAVFCTGLAKHENCEFIKSSNNFNWQYIALYGLQTLSEDSLGIAVFYQKSDLIKNTENNDSYVVVLNSENNSLNYYFAAAWEKEPGGIKNIGEFKKYLDDQSALLSSPVEINIE